MTDCSHIACAKPRRPIGVFARLHQSLSLGRQRRALARLERHQLRDIGISPNQAHAESTRPIWDAPQHWKA
ncbi:MAG: DUF1127 domain-containing protein [Pseudorhodobacter sp.]